MIDPKLDDLVKSRKCSFSVIPVEAGIQYFQAVIKPLDPVFQRGDGFLRIHQNLYPEKSQAGYIHIIMEAHTEIKLIAEKENLNKLRDIVVSFARQNGFDSEKIWELELITEEIFTNIIRYAYPSNKGSIEVNCLCPDGKNIVLEFYDYGVPFDPCSYPEPVFASDIQRIQARGTGIFLVRRLVDHITYKRDGNKNCLILEKRSCL